MIARARLITILFLLVVSLGHDAHAWWNKDWGIRKPFTVDTTETGVPIGDPVGDVVLLLRLHDGNFQFAQAAADGADLRFVAEDDKTLLPFQVERYDSLLNEGFVWVRVPGVKPKAQTKFWLYYGFHGTDAGKAADAKETF